MVETMQFRDFIFPHNPHTITVDQQPGVAVFFCPGAGDVVQSLGRGGRTVRCQGSFFGGSYGSALDQLTGFRSRAGDGVRGMLLVPGFPPFLAVLAQLTFDATGDGRVIPYTMVFREAGEV